MPRKASLAARHSRISKHADAFRTSCEGSTHPDGWVDTTRLLAASGARVEVASDEADVVIDVRGGQLVIPVRPGLSSAEQRMAVAYALGRKVLSGPRSWLVKAPIRRDALGGVDVDARLFAVCLLMPARSFREAHRDLGGDVDELARHFEVPVKSVRYMRHALRLTDGPATDVYP